MQATLQINVAPPDLGHAGHVLSHQLRTWAGQVDEVLFTYDTTPPARGRFGTAWEEQRPGMDALLAGLCDQYPHARIGEVDASPVAQQAVAKSFLTGDRVPAKDSRGGPMYAYFFGWHDAAHDLVLHSDSDLLYGGGSPTWLAEASRVLDQHEDVLFAGPLPGPPRPDGTLLGQPGARPFGTMPYAFAFPTVSSRVFLFDRTRAIARLGPLPLRPPVLRRSRIKARINGHPPFAMPEQMFSRALQERHAHRVDLLGTGPGMWSLHPAARSPNFYAALPELVARVERGDMPDAQRGVYDVSDALVDWSDVERPGPLRRLLR